MPPWHDTDDFWLTFFPAMFTDDVMDRAIDDVAGVIALTDPAPGCAVLDVCCGPGRHSLEFARRGFRVTGVDRTAAYLERAGATAAEKGLDVEFVQCDARVFSRPAAFDLAINLFTSFGYFEDPQDDCRLARAVFDALRPGGKLVIELMGKEIVARVFAPRSWSERDGLLMLEERQVTEDWSWSDNRWLLVKDGQVHEQRLGHRIYSAAELKALLLDVGFSEAQAFGSLQGAPYDQNARRLVVVARRG
jgi:SAM-dependent methyltransferase